jgi:hypothetical protein
MDKDFLQKIGPITLQFTQISLNVSQLQRMELCVRQLLKVSDMGRLRDMFEGDAFRRNFLIRTSAELAFEKLLGSKIIDWDQKSSSKSYKPIFMVDGMRIEIFASSYGIFPVITDQPSDYSIIAFLREPKVVLFCGCIKTENIKIGLRKAVIKSLKADKILGYFEKFDILSPFSDIDDLKKLINPL